MYRNVPAKQRCVGGDACLALAVNGVHQASRRNLGGKAQGAPQAKFEHAIVLSILGIGQRVFDGKGARTHRRRRPSRVSDASIVLHAREAREASDDEMSTSSASHTFAHLAKNFQFDPQGSTIKDVPEILTNILIAAAERSPHGYCRGFVVPAAVMLLLTDDEEASFWMLAGLTEDVLSSFISRSAINLYSEAKYVDLEISLNEPELTAFLNKGECRSEPPSWDS